jgi:hypothetical protein
MGTATKRLDPMSAGLVSVAPGPAWEPHSLSVTAFEHVMSLGVRRLFDLGKKSRTIIVKVLRKPSLFVDSFGSPITMRTLAMIAQSSLLGCWGQLRA